MHVVLISLSHARDIKKNKAKLDQQYYSIPESCIVVLLYTYVHIAAQPEKKRPRANYHLKWYLHHELDMSSEDLIDMGSLAIMEKGTFYVTKIIYHGFHKHSIKLKEDMHHFKKHLRSGCHCMGLSRW